MRRIITATFTSLDGVIQAPGGPQEDPTGGFTFGGWVAPHFDDALGAAMGEIFGRPFDLLLGRKTYEIFAAHWPYVGPDDPIGQAFDRCRKYVLTHGHEALDWTNSQRLAGIDDVAVLKQSEGPDLLIQGSSTLYPQLLAAGLIDRLSLITFPVVLGQGKRLFGQDTPSSAWRLINHQVSTTGATIATYEPAGAVPIGSFQLPEPSEAEKRRQERMKREG